MKWNKIKILATKHNAQQIPFFPFPPKMTHYSLRRYLHGTNPRDSTLIHQEISQATSSYFRLGRLLAALGSAIISATSS